MPKALLDFSRTHKDKPFFYLAHNIPHTPWGVQGLGRPERGFYGDVIEELD